MEGPGHTCHHQHDTASCKLLVNICTVGIILLGYYHISPPSKVSYRTLWWGRGKGAEIFVRF